MASTKTKLSAAMLALLAAGATAPELLDPFMSEKKAIRWWLLSILVVSGPYIMA